MKKLLKRIRDREGLSQEEISSLMGISQGLYSMVEGGNRKASLHFCMVLRSRIDLKPKDQDAVNAYMERMVR